MQETGTVVRRLSGQIIILLLVISACPDLAAQLPGATTVTVGQGWPLGPTPPRLVCTPPVLGGPLTFTASSCPSSLTGYLCISPGTQVPTNLGWGCMIRVDPVNYLALGPFLIDASGDWSFTLYLGNDPAMAGSLFTSQLIVFPVTTNPLGIAITNAVTLRLGI